MTRVEVDPDRALHHPQVRRVKGVAVGRRPTPRTRNRARSGLGTRCASAKRAIGRRVAWHRSDELEASSASAVHELWVEPDRLAVLAHVTGRRLVAILRLEDSSKEIDGLVERVQRRRRIADPAKGCRLTSSRVEANRWLRRRRQRSARTFRRTSELFDRPISGDDAHATKVFDENSRRQPTRKLVAQPLARGPCSSYRSQPTVQCLQARRLTRAVAPQSNLTLGPIGERCVYSTQAIEQAAGRPRQRQLHARTDRVQAVA